MNTNAQRIVTKARVRLLTMQPFFGTLALRLMMKEMPDDLRAVQLARGLTPTLAVDGVNIFYAPEFVEKLAAPEVEGVIAHEVMHCVMDHTGRRGDRDPMRWNIATDFAINLLIRDAGLTLPAGGCLDDSFKGMTAEAIYNLLPESLGGSPLCDVLDGESKKDPTLTDEWKIATAQAAMAAQRAGKLPAHMQRFVDELLNPTIDWRQQLRQFITEITRDDYSWARPNKRMVVHDFYVPSLWNEAMGELVVVVDTSGSITDHMLQVFGSEIQAIRDSVRPKMTRVVYCDADVNHVDSFEAEDLLELKMHGGGGTDFRPPFALVEQEGWRPKCLVYLTDLYGPMPDQPPEFPTIWACTTDQVAAWGETLKVDANV